MSAELARMEQDGIARIDHVSGGLALTFSEMAYRVKELDRFYREVMQKGTDYDVIPGTPKPTLLQPGAQMLDAIFGLAPRFEDLPGTVEDYEHGFFAYKMRCRLVSKATGETVAEGLGTCNSKEDKYRWRQGKRRCPECGEAAIIKGKAEYGGGWVCFKRQGGCGEKFVDEGAFAGQVVGRVENDDPYTLANTILKMAQKRAHVAATLNATGASRIFTQDVEDLIVPEPRAVAHEVVEAAVRRPAPEPMLKEQQHAEAAVNGDPPPKRVFTIKDKQEYFAQLQSEARALGLHKGPLHVTALLVRQADVMSAAEIESDGKKLREAIRAERERRKAQGDDPDAAF